MKYIISGRNIRIEPAEGNKTGNYKPRPRDSQGRFASKGGKKTEKWQRFFVLAKEINK